MELQKNSQIYGFTVTDIIDMPDQNGTLYKMVHDQTGAQAAWLKRDDSNKTFAITFKTIPFDDTGVFHMLEHSVLNGSEKYPVREPFVELLKSSMQTFLNAFTYPDKTMYPVSSRNDTDFMNLMSVYMDAVFHPAIYHNPNIFYQEGWHYEIRKKEDEPVFKGVVLNEMKGAFSSVDETIIDTFNRMLFPDNCYKYVSGGDPVHIPDLTYEKFIETHQKFYHPSNARVFLDGDMNIDEVLSFIDSEYFSKYQKEQFNFDIPMQKAVNASHIRYEYELAPNESVENRTQIAFAKVISDYTDVEKNLAWSILSSILTANNESPLKKEILDQKLGQDVELDIVDGIEQPWAVLNVRNTNENNYDQVRSVLQNTARELIKNGLDHDDIIATLNQAEFSYREKHEPAGIIYAQRSMMAWLYGGEPEAYLSIGSLFEDLRQKTNEGYFEKLLEEFLLDDAHLCSLTAVPSVTLGEKRTNAEKERLHNAKLSWKDDIQKYIDLNKSLDQWQATPDTEEQLNTLPHLSLSDVEKRPEDFPYEEREISHVPVLVHPEESSGIVYMNLYFNLAGLTKDFLPQLGLWSSLLMSLSTKEHSVSALQQLVKRDLGSLSFYLDAYSPAHDHETCIPVLGVSVSALKQNIHKIVPLLKEIMFDTIYDKEAILPLLKQDNEDFRQSLIMSGHAAAVRRISAHYSAEGAFREYVGGYESAVYEKDLEDHYDDNIQSFINDCGLFADVLFSKDRLTASVSGEDNLSIVEELIQSLHTVEASKAKMHYPLLEDKKEVILIPAAISYAAIGSNLTGYGIDYEPKMKVLQHDLTYTWLWNEVRVKGGAYGTGISFNPNGNTAAYSYRDPDPLNALRAFKEAGKYAEEVSRENKPLDQMIIGAVSSTDPLLSPSGKIKLGDVQYLRGLNYEERVYARKEILDTKPEDYHRFAKPLADAFEDGTIVIVGNEETLKQLKDDEFHQLRQL